MKTSRSFAKEHGTLKNLKFICSDRFEEKCGGEYSICYETIREICKECKSEGRPFRENKKNLKHAIETMAALETINKLGKLNQQVKNSQL